MNVALWLARAAQRFGTRSAVGHGRDAWCSYAELAQRAAALAAWLRARGVMPGDRVALFLPNRPQYLVMLWGVWWSGAAAVPINAKLHAREVAWILQHSGTRLAFCDAGAHEALRALAPDVTLLTDLPPLPAQDLPAPPADRADTDPAWLFYTSGTTGRPKGVVLGARQLR